MGRVCPWWLGYVLLNPLRKLIQNPETILGLYLEEGMIAVDVGSGMGYFGLPMAKLVGERGRVICVDLQEKMVSSLRKRAQKAGLSARIETRLAERQTLNLARNKGSADFALAFAVAHEVPDRERFLREIFDVLKPEGTLLLSEPKGHVNVGRFAETRSKALAVGFKASTAPPIRRAHTALFVKPPTH